MRYTRLIVSLTLLLAAISGTVYAQQDPYPTIWAGNLNSHPSDPVDCGVYQWPEVVEPCPDVQIKQKHDHTSLFRDEPVPWSDDPSEQGWDTVITCASRDSGGIVLSCMPYLPVRYFNGYYTVDPIPYDPPDPTFHISYPGYDTPLKKKMDISQDDYFASQAVDFGNIFPFYFFGKRKNKFRLGDNGLVTFSDSEGAYDATNNNKCDWSCPVPLPWNSNTSGDTPFTFGTNCMRDAIYGVFQDTHVLPNTVTGNQGIYFGVVESYPGDTICRKIIASWNEIPLYNSQTNNRQSYQIVCYEGSNMIEVHIKRRAGNGPGGDNGSCTCNNQGVIGIQNATGLPQVKGTPSEPTILNVYTGAPAAFWPLGKNSYYDSENYTAYRFTPQGEPQADYHWFRILDTYHYDTIAGVVHTVYDTVHLRNVLDFPDAQYDTNGYIYPMNDPTYPSCPTLTRAVVNPTVTSRYVFHLMFRTANNEIYNLYDTIVIGQDTTATMELYANGDTTHSKRLNICEGSPANLTLKYPAHQVPDSVTYSVYRISNGDRIELGAQQSLDILPAGGDRSNVTQPINLRASLPNTGRLRNKVDSVYVQVYITFTSGCYNYDTMLVGTYPNFDTTEVEGICQGESFTWSANDHTYVISTQATEYLQSEPGCDSTVHLDLTVYSRSYTIDTIVDCQPYTWIDSNTYYESNNSTALGDTILLKNRWDCDSTVQLQFSLLPVKAHIKVDRDYFDYDHLDAVLTDVSENNHDRIWRLPGGSTMSGINAYYTIPAEYDEADISLVASATYRDHTCFDTTNVVIPLRKENFWLPNAFMPGSNSGNNTFGSISTRTIMEEMFIYNRNGSLVFKCDSPDCQWDGRDLNGNPCPQGTYMYFIRYSNEFLPKVVHVLRGSVTLIR